MSGRSMSLVHAPRAPPVHQRLSPSLPSPRRRRPEGSVRTNERTVEAKLGRERGRNLLPAGSQTPQHSCSRSLPQPHGRVVAFPTRPKPQRRPLLPHTNICTEYSAQPPAADPSAIKTKQTKNKANPPARRNALSVPFWTHEIFRWDPGRARDESRAVTDNPKSKSSP